MANARKRNAPVPGRLPLARLAAEVVRNWEQGDLAAAVNRLRIAAEQLDRCKLAVIRQALRFVLGRPEAFARWLVSKDSGKERDLRGLSTEDLADLIYELLNEDLA